MKKRYVVIYRYWDGSKEQDEFETKVYAKYYSRRQNANGYDTVVKYRTVKD